MLGQEHGFAWVGNEIKILNFSQVSKGFSNREPQQFGMVSFRDCGGDDFPERHLKKFGFYGIAVNPKWADSHNIRKVIYLSKISWDYLYLRRQVKEALEELEVILNKNPNDSYHKMAYHNINVAGLIGATKWAKILSIYQILEPRRNKSEVEWRIVNPNPNYSISSDSKHAISEVSPPKGWAKVVSLLKIEKEDITAFTCPNGKGQILKASLPEQYSKVRILELY